MAELKDIKATVHPTDTLLVVDAMTGQEAATLVKSFNDQVDISGAILTKMDGDSRGGAALSVREVSAEVLSSIPARVKSAQKATCQAGEKGCVSGGSSHVAVELI